LAGTTLFRQLYLMTQSVVNDSRTDSRSIEPAQVMKVLIGLFEQDSQMCTQCLPQVGKPTGHGCRIIGGIQQTGSVVLRTFQNVHILRSLQRLFEFVNAVKQCRTM
jgi:hypothetical protein